MPYENFNPRLPGGRRRDFGSATEAAVNFNPRLPGGRRPRPDHGALQDAPFQSTPPGWEATEQGREVRPPSIHFNPRLPGGRRLEQNNQLLLLLQISIHASRVGGDAFSSFRYSRISDFNPRLPGGRRLNGGCALPTGTTISIHASRVGGDGCCRPPTPRREPFQSTPPGWEATAKIYEEWSDSLGFLLNSPRGCS